MQMRDGDSAYAEVQKIVDTMQRDGELNVLEAGCGGHGWFKLQENIRLAGIDISPEQLYRNIFLHDRILGDLQEHPLEKSHYDVVFCCFVIEHLAHPERALLNMAESVRRGGILVLTAPVRESLKGTITRLTPHWFHVMFYKYLLNYPRAGEPGCPPFPTYLRKSMSHHSIAKFAHNHGMTMELMATYDSGLYSRIRKSSVIAYHAVLATGFLVKILTFGAIRPDITDYAIVLRRNPEQAAAELAQPAEVPAAQGVSPGLRHAS